MGIKFPNSVSDASGLSGAAGTDSPTADLADPTLSPGGLTLTPVLPGDGPRIFPLGHDHAEALDDPLDFSAARFVWTSTPYSGWLGDVVGELLGAAKSTDDEDLTAAERDEAIGVALWQHAAPAIIATYGRERGDVDSEKLARDLTGLISEHNPELSRTDARDQARAIAAGVAQSYESPAPSIPLAGRIPAVPAGVGHGPADHFPLGELGALDTAGTAGAAFRLDGSALGEAGLSGGMRVNVRAIEHPEHGAGLELNFDLRHIAELIALQARIESVGGRRLPFNYEGTSYDDGRLVLDPVNRQRFGERLPHNWVLQDEGRFQIDVMDPLAGYADSRTPQYAMLGKARLRVFGEGADLEANAIAAIEAAGLSTLLADADPEGQAKLERIALLWQRAPRLADAIMWRDLRGVSIDEIDQALKAAGVTADDVGRLRSAEVFPGYWATIDPAQGERYEELGIRYVQHGVRKLEHIAMILGSDGLMGTEERYSRGLFVAGASSRRDVETGGADSVFLRLISSHADDNKYGGWGGAQIIYSTELLDRTDWYAFESDRYGTVVPGTTEKNDYFLNRLYGEELVNSLDNNGRFRSSNEIMMRRGISNRMVERIFVKKPEDVGRLIAMMRDSGINDINGRPLEDVVTHRAYYSDEKQREHERTVLTEAGIEDVDELTEQQWRVLYLHHASASRLISAIVNAETGHITDRTERNAAKEALKEALAELEPEELLQRHEATMTRKSIIDAMVRGVRYNEARELRAQLAELDLATLRERAVNTHVAKLTELGVTDDVSDWDIERITGFITEMEQIIRKLKNAKVTELTGSAFELKTRLAAVTRNQAVQAVLRRQRITSIGDTPIAEASTEQLEAELERVALDKQREAIEKALAEAEIEELDGSPLGEASLTRLVAAHYQLLRRQAVAKVLPEDAMAGDIPLEELERLHTEHWIQQLLEPEPPDGEVLPSPSSVIG